MIGLGSGGVSLHVVLAFVNVIAAGALAFGVPAAAQIAVQDGLVNVAVGDVTGDGHPDVVTLNHTAQTVSVLAGDGSGGFAAAVNFPIFVHPGGEPCTSPDGAWQCPWPWGMTVADITGDGHLDIVTADTDNDTVTVLVNDGAGDFTEFFHFGTGAHPGAVAVADITGANPNVFYELGIRHAMRPRSTVIWRAAWRRLTLAPTAFA